MFCQCQRCVDCQNLKNFELSPLTVTKVTVLTSLVRTLWSRQTIKRQHRWLWVCGISNSDEAGTVFRRPIHLRFVPHHLTRQHKDTNIWMVNAIINAMSTHNTVDTKSHQHNTVMNTTIRLQLFNSCTHQHSAHQHVSTPTQLSICQNSHQQHINRMQLLSFYVAGFRACHCQSVADCLKIPSV